MEADRRAVREAPRERAEAGERGAGCALSKRPTAAATCASGSRGRAPRGLRRRRPRAETGRPDALQADAVEQALAPRRPARARRARARRAAAPAGASRSPAGAGTTGRTAAARARSPDAGGRRRGRRTACRARRPLPGATRPPGPPRPAQNRASPRWSCTTRAPRVELASWASRSSEPSGQEASAAPTFASSESCCREERRLRRPRRLVA